MAGIGPVQIHIFLISVRIDCTVLVQTHAILNKCLVRSCLLISRIMCRDWRVSDLRQRKCSPGTQSAAPARNVATYMHIVTYMENQI